MFRSKLPPLVCNPDFWCKAPEDFETSYKSGFGQFEVVTAFFEKQTDDASELTVQIVVDGQVEKEQTTTAAYGGADVS